MQITPNQLRAIMPHSPATPDWTPILNAAMSEFGIAVNRQRIAAFLAQIAHESRELNAMEESLYYKTAARIVAVWPKRFPAEAAAAPYVAQPQKLANLVYANRIGNGSVASGDGWRYRGRGLMQITGRGNYASVGTRLNLDLLADPDLLKQPLPAARAAGLFWQSHGLNELADDRSGDDDDEDFVTISVRINGGRAGLAERRRLWAQAKAVLGA